MLSDFDSDTLPVASDRTYDTSRSHRLATTTWRHVSAAAATVALKCLELPTLAGGWMRVNDDIAVMMLPERSLMRLYWANDLVLRRIGVGNQTDTFE